MTEKSDPALQLAFICPLASGVHARPASHLAEVANQFASECTVTNLRNGLVAKGKSVLGLIAADIRHGDHCILRVSGPDERTASATLHRFIEETLPRCDVPLAGIAEANRISLPPRALRAMNVDCIPGVPVSKGIGVGRVAVLRRMALPEKGAGESPTDRQRELDRVQEAVAAVRHRIGEKLKYSITPAGAAVLQADLAIAGDVVLIEKLREQILSGKSAAQAVVETGEFFIALLGHSENEYIRQRSADIEEICLQLLEELGAAAPEAALELAEDTVLVAETLGPQQLLEMDRRWLKALVLEHSATATHAAILARSLGIPTLVGVRTARLVLTPGCEVVVDANHGIVVPRVNAAVLRFYEREQRTVERRREARSRAAGQSASTSDGKRLEVGANASSGEEMAMAFENGADGIGLFRTEMLFLGREQAPSEEEQYAIYSQAARAARSRSVVIRTFDIGGDKRVGYLNLAREENPFLGYRGARIYGEHRDLLQSQLRAILRASVEGGIQIMAPMISSIEEVLEFKSAVAQAKHDLTRKGTPFRTDIKIGIMIEVPSLGFVLDQLCTEVDFFSIGTNDLSQYFFAADRSNPRVATLFPVRHPAFLRFLRQMVEPIHRAGKWVGMCGEMAADTLNLPVLLGLGLDEISVPAAEVSPLKQAISKLTAAECAIVLDHALACATAADVDHLLTAQPFHNAHRPLLSDDLVQLDGTSQNKEEVIREMVDALYISGRTDDRHLLEEAVWARETMGSTGLGYGFAVPHCKSDAVTANSICVLRLPQPINWDGDRSERVNMVVLLALRDSDVANTHMQIFSMLARKLMNEDFRQHLLKVETAADVTDYLSGQLGIPSPD